MITVNNIELRRGAKLIFKDASARINPSQKAGLIGSNGSGKSTF